METEYNSSMFQLLLFKDTMVFFYFSFKFLLCIKQTLHCTSYVASQNRPVGQCESFMARRMESVRGNLFCPEQERTLSQSLALRQEGSAYLETKHEHNHSVGSHSYRKRFMPPVLPSSVTHFIGFFDDKFPLQ